MRGVISKKVMDSDSSILPRGRRIAPKTTIFDAGFDNSSWEWDFFELIVWEDRYIFRDYRNKIWAGSVHTFISSERVEVEISAIRAGGLYVYALKRSECQLQLCLWPLFHISASWGRARGFPVQGRRAPKRFLRSYFCLVRARYMNICIKIG